MLISASKQELSLLLLKFALDATTTNTMNDRFCSVETKLPSVIFAPKTIFLSKIYRKLLTLQKHLCQDKIDYFEKKDEIFIHELLGFYLEYSSLVRLASKEEERFLVQLASLDFHHFDHESFNNIYVEQSESDSDDEDNEENSSATTMSEENSSVTAMNNVNSDVIPNIRLSLKNKSMHKYIISNDIVEELSSLFMISKELPMLIHPKK